MPRVLEHAVPYADGTSARLLDTGPESGPVVLLVPGAMPYWSGWVGQIEALSAAGYRVFAAEQPEAGSWRRPSAIVAHTTEEQAATLVGALQSLGVVQFAAVGHDWGGALVWWIAEHRAALMSRGVVVSCPHPAVLRHARASWWGAQESWYRRFFRAGGMPPHRCGDLPGALRELEAAPQPPLSGATLRPGLRAVLNWHRVLASAAPRVPSQAVRSPMRLVWGAEDTCFGIALAHASLAACAEADLDVVEDAAHWVQCERPHEVNAILRSYLAV